MPSLAAAEFPFPDHTRRGYYPLSDGTVFVPEQLMQFDRFCLVRAFIDSGLPPPDTYLAIPKGALADVQEVSYLIGAASPDGQRNVNIHVVQTRRFDTDNKPLPKPEIRVIPTRRQLSNGWMQLLSSYVSLRKQSEAPTRVFGILDEMLDEGETMQTAGRRIGKIVPAGSLVITMATVAKLKEMQNGTKKASTAAMVVGREVEDLWMRMANQFESLEHKHAVVQEVRDTYPTYDQDMSLYHADALIRYFFPELIDAGIAA